MRGCATEEATTESMLATFEIGRVASNSAIFARTPDTSISGFPCECAIKVVVGQGTCSSGKYISSELGTVSALNFTSETTPTISR
jgi:hypothetical protein